LKFQDSIRFKLIFASVLIEIVMLSLLLGNSIRLVNKTIEQQTNQKIEAFSPLMEAAISIPLFEHDYATLEGLLSQLRSSSQTTFSYIAVLDSKGQLYAFDGDPKFNPLPAIDQSITSAFDDLIFDSRSTIKIGGVAIGEVQYGMSIASFVTAKENLFNQGILIALLEILLTIGLLAFIGYLLTRHLSDLMNGTEKLMLGQYKVKIPIHSEDEIGLLAGKFNKMASVIDGQVTALHSSKDALLRGKAKFESLFNSLSDGIVFVNLERECIMVNPSVKSLFGYCEKELLGKKLGFIYAEQKEYLELGQLRIHPEAEEAISAFEATYQKKDGKTFRGEIHVSKVRDDLQNLVGYVGIIRDISETKALSNELKWQARHDDLTGLVNRREFESLLSQAIDDVKQLKKQCTVLYIDLDQFKIVNDTSGHIAGDELLRQISFLITNLLPINTLFARLGGDEFGVLLNNQSIDNAREMAEKIRTAADRFHFYWKDNVFQIGVSIGMAEITDETHSITTLMSAVDLACYSAKEAGRNRIHIYQENEDKLANRQGELIWVNRLKEALEKDLFKLYCQPIVPINPHKRLNRHYEVLIRLQEDNGQIIPPILFLPAAEKFGLMPAIDLWVVKTALGFQEQLAVSKRFSIALNLSGQSLSSQEFLDSIVEIIIHSSLDPRLICFEVTETTAIQNLSTVIPFMHKLQALGSSFALDDFGSGLSSFGYLKNLPFDFIKIDGCFIKDILHQPFDKAMVNAIHEVSKVMGIKTIAEYVENQDIQDYLITIGIDFAQGFNISKPFPMEKLHEYEQIA